LRARTRFQQYRGRRVLFSCFSRPDSFSAARRASHLVFMFCAPGLIFGGTEGVGYRFPVLPARTHFRQYRGRPLPFSCFLLRDMFSAVPRASGPVFMFYAAGLISGGDRGRLIPFFMFSAPGYVFGGTKGVGSRFHVLRSWTHFRRYRGRQVPF
jgi:hypothetical protein